jgi:hypothetical protein
MQPLMTGLTTELERPLSEQIIVGSEFVDGQMVKERNDDDFSEDIELQENDVVYDNLW